MTNRQDANRIFDFISLTPEAMQMITWLFSPRGIPASYREMDGFGVNTYKMVNAEGGGVLVKYHWKTRQGIRSLTQAEAEAIQAANFNHASQDLYEAIERGEYPGMGALRPGDVGQRPPGARLRPAGRDQDLAGGSLPAASRLGGWCWIATRSTTSPRWSRSAFGTGVLVDGLEFSDDKLLQGRTFSYSDTQRHRIGPNYQQLPINRAKSPVATNQRDGQMAYLVDGNEAGANPHVNYEPSSRGGPVEAVPPGAPHEPYVEGRLVRQKISRTDDYAQAGERYRAIEAWERDDLIFNLVGQLEQCNPDIQERMVEHLSRCDAEYGRRVAEGLGIETRAVRLIGRLRQGGRALIRLGGSGEARPPSGLRTRRCES